MNSYSITQSKMSYCVCALIAFLVFLILATLSCKKEESNINQTPPILLLKQINVDGNNHKSYFYEGTALTRIELIHGGLTYTETFSYSGDTTTSFFGAPLVGSTKKTYYPIDKNQKRVDIRDWNGSRSYWIYTIGDLDCGFTQIDKYHDNGSQEKVVIQYTDANCSSIIETYSAANTLFTLEETNRNQGITHDRNSRIDFFHFPTTGNVESYKHQHLGTTIRNDYSYTSQFEYNVYRYPRKEVRTYLDGNVEVYDFEYY